MNEKDKKYHEDYFIWQYLCAKITGTYIYNEAEFRQNNQKIDMTSSIYYEMFKNCSKLF